MGNFGKVAILDASPKEAQGLSDCVAERLNTEKNPVQIKMFKDDERDVNLRDSVRDRDVFIWQTKEGDDIVRWGEFQYTVSAVNSSGGANRVTAVFPYCFGQRGERQTGPRQSVPIEVVVRNLYSMGVRNVITVGLHTEAIQTVFRTTGERRGIRVEHFPFEPLAAQYIKLATEAQNYDSIVVASPDAGGGKRIERVSNILLKRRSDLEIELAFGHKVRQGEDQPKLRRLVGQVEGKPVFLYDDIGDTLGTITQAAKVAKEEGATALYVCLIHPVLGRGYEKRLETLCNDDLVVEVAFSNTIPLKTDAICKHPKIRTIRIDPILTAMIHGMNSGQSLSRLFHYDDVLNAYKTYPVPLNHQDVDLVFGTYVPAKSYEKVEK